MGAAIAKAAQIAVAATPRPRRGVAGGGASPAATVVLILHPRVNGAPPGVSLPAPIAGVQRRAAVSSTVTLRGGGIAPEVPRVVFGGAGPPETDATGV